MDDLSFPGKHATTRIVPRSNDASRLRDERKKKMRLQSAAGHVAASVAAFAEVERRFAAA
jgi:hypothetical protein